MDSETNHSYLQHVLLEERNSHPVAYKKFFQSSTTTNLDWTDPISEKIIEILKDKKKPKDNVNLSFKFYHEYYQGDSFDYKKIIRKEIGSMNYF